MILFLFFLCPQPDVESSNLPRLGLHWRVFYPEKVVARLDTPLNHIVIITKGAIRMRFPVLDGPHGRLAEHTVVASVGERSQQGQSHLQAASAERSLQLSLLEMPAKINSLMHAGLQRQEATLLEQHMSSGGKQHSSYAGCRLWVA